MPIGIRLFGLALGGAAVLGVAYAPQWAEGRAAPEPAVVLIEPAITWSPEYPGEGRLFTIRVTASIHTPIMGVRGEVGTEELHFRRLDERVFESLAAVPVGAGSEVSASVRVAYEAGGEESFSESIAVTPGRYVHEELRVTPRFGSPLNDADQAQLAQDQARALEAARQAHRTPALWSDDVIMPRSSRVTSGFGDGRVFNGQVSSRHMGLDLQGLRGDTVLASTRGVVTLVEPFLLAGNIVYLNHGGGLLSAYFHLSEQLVSVGDTVEAGTPIGRVGATGRVTGPHLHWVVRYGRTSVDPRSLLEVMGATPPG